MSRDTLNRLVRTYRGYFKVPVSRDLTTADLRRFDPQVGHRLYKELLHDILKGVPANSQVIIVPDEVLGLLPFEALIETIPSGYRMAKGPYGPYPKGLQYVGDTRPISYAQSATSLAMVRRLRTKSRATKPMLVVADPVFHMADARAKGGVQLAKVSRYQHNLMRAVEDEGGFHFPRLKETAVLARQLQTMFGRGVKVLEGLGATTAELGQQRLRDYRYLVFATHGILDNQVAGLREPALVMTQVGTSDTQDGFLTMTEVMDLRLDAEVSALIACDTGSGKQVSGEGVMGLGRAFQYAGARNVLVSLWSVAENSTTAMTKHFFSQLKQGKSPAVGLRSARRAIRQAGYEHPFYWAPFIMIGDTQ